MTWQLVKNEFKQKKYSLLVYCISGAAFVWLYISLFPSLQTQAAQLSKLYQTLPKDVMKAFGAEGTGLETVESLLSTKQFGLVWPLMTIFLLLSRSASAIAGEIENNTIGTLLSQPISRAKIYTSKYLSAVLALAIFVFTTVLVNIPIISLYHLSFSLKYEIYFAVICFLYGLMILGVGFAISAISSERSRVYSIVGGLVGLMFVLNIVSGLKSSLDFLKYSSIFYYFQSAEIIVKHHINFVSLYIFAFIAVVGFFAGLELFMKRDISA